MYDDEHSIRVMLFFARATKVLSEFDSLPPASDREEMQMRPVLRRALVNSFRAELMSLGVSGDHSGTPAVSADRVGEWL